MWAQTDWTQFGIAGVFAGLLLTAQLWFMRHLLTITLPAQTATFALELRRERARHRRQHIDHREDFEKLYKRVEKSEQIVANALQANRHRLANAETVISGLCELIKYLREDVAQGLQLLRKEEDPHRSGPPLTPKEPA